MNLQQLVLFVPSVSTTLYVGVAGWLYVTFAATLAGFLRAKKGMRVPYTRKIYHFTIITGAAVVQMNYGLGGISVYGSIVTLLVLFAVYRGKGFSLYEAMARQTDAPREKLFIMIPMITTASGGIISNVLFYPWAPVGYIVCGWGDAVGEPIGSAWGKHRYSVPSIGGVRAERSLEGSAAVFVASFFAAGAALWGFGLPLSTVLYVGLLCGLGTTAVEAVSHHGLDNLNIQVVASGLTYFLLG